MMWNKGRGSRRATDANFDWTKATPQELGYSYVNEGFVRFSVGKKDWIPVGVVIYDFYEGSHSYDSLITRIQRDAWIDQTDTSASDWLSTNKKCLRKFVRFCYNQPLLSFERRKDIFRHPSALAYTPHRMAQAYLSALHRAYPEIENDIYWVGDELGEDYWLDPAISAARDAAYHAFEATKDFATSWFEARGIKVNRSDRTVMVPGYQPLCTLGELIF